MLVGTNTFHVESKIVSVW